MPLETAPEESVEEVDVPAISARVPGTGLDQFKSVRSMPIRSSV